MSQYFQRILTAPTPFGVETRATRKPRKRIAVTLHLPDGASADDDVAAIERLTARLRDLGHPARLAPP